MTDVNPPPMLRIPDSLRSNREEFGFFRQLNTILFQLWTRTGGPDDAISTLENGELYEPGIQTSDADERVDDLETDISILQGQIEQIDEPDQDLFYSLLERVQSLELDAETWARQDTEEMEIYNYDVEVHKGNVPGVLPVNKYGHATDCDSSVLTDVWAGADGATSTDIWVPPTVARVHQITSSSANDTLLGTGARTIRVKYLPDWDSKETSVDLELDGVGNVATPACVTINRLKALTWGSGGVNAGIITVTADTDSTITAMIAAGDNQTQQCIVGFSSQQDLLINVAKCGITRGSGGTVRITGEMLFMPDPATNAANNTAWVVQEELDHLEGAPFWKHEYTPQKKLDGPGIVKIQVSASANNAQAIATLDGYLVDK